MTIIIEKNKYPGLPFTWGRLAFHDGVGAAWTASASTSSLSSPNSNSAHPPRFDSKRKWCSPHSTSYYDMKENNLIHLLWPCVAAPKKNSRAVWCACVCVCRWVGRVGMRGGGRLRGSARVGSRRISDLRFFSGDKSLVSRWQLLCARQWNSDFCIREVRVFLCFLGYSAQNKGTSDMVLPVASSQFAALIKNIIDVTQWNRGKPIQDYDLKVIALLTKRSA